ncbi:hypothetical protein [Brevibacterium atlanticum]|uniref:hypothetical protein n=1 Tax=Brevibacterium atlanticum TaxID=2697563 RepID=UPI00141F5552|nr:hypothetical protein [Brevibacterium atlanticum]
MLNPDGSLTEVATIDGDEFEHFDMPQPTEVRTVAAGDDGVVVEVEYASSDCR